MSGACCFIAGTGTGVGKTMVCAALLRALRGAGLDAVSMKPVQTGARQTSEGLRAQDLDAHRAAAGLPEASMAGLEVLAPYRYPEACSPHLAGRIARSYPEIDRICTLAAGLRAQHDMLLVEGAGGVLVPLDESRTMLDLMRALGCPVLLVAHAGLGTINHTLLSLAAMRGAGLAVLGVVLCEGAPMPDGIVKQDNPRAIEQFGKVPVLGYLRHQSALREDAQEGERSRAPHCAWDAAAVELAELKTVLISTEARSTRSIGQKKKTARERG